MSQQNDRNSGLLAGLRGIIGRKTSTTVEVVEGLLSPAAFEQALTKERSRTDRGGASFVMLLITVCAPRESESFRQTSRLAGEVLVERTRNIDTKGWYGDRLGVVLPQTLADQAQIVWQHIDEAYRKKLRASSESQVALAALKSEIYTYPSDGKHHALSEAQSFKKSASEQ